MSYIQVELDAMNLYPRVAMMAGIDLAWVHMGFNELWAHCYRARTDRIPVDMLGGFFPVTPQLVATLVTCAFIEVIDDGRTLRVRGTERYERVATKSEAGRKGGRATAAKAVRSGGRFTKQPPSNDQAATKQDQSVGRAFSPSTTKQAPSSHQATTKQNGVPGEVSAPSSESPSNQASNQALTKQPPSNTPSTLQAEPSKHQALYPRDISLSLSSPLRDEVAQAQAQARTHVHAHEAPAPTPARSAVDLSAETRAHGPQSVAAWPNPDCENAGLRWYKRLAEKRPYGFAYTLDDVKRVAMACPDQFAEAADEMSDGERGWGGRTDVLAWLRRSCDFVAERQADRNRKCRENAPGTRYSPRIPPPAGSDYPPASDGPRIAENEPSQACSKAHILPSKSTATPETVTRWQKLKADLCEVVEPWDFDHWIKPLQAVRLDAEVVLSAPDVSHAEWVEEHFKGFIAGALEKHGIKPPERLAFEVWS